jgi:hypothetical protein
MLSKVSGWLRERRRQRGRSNARKRVKVSLANIEALEGRQLLAVSVTSLAQPVRSTHGETFPTLSTQRESLARAAAHPHVAHRGAAGPISESVARATVTGRGREFDSPANGQTGVYLAPSTSPLTPAQVRHAYGIDQLRQDGTGQKIAIIDAYDDPTIANDVATFSRRYGLPQADLTKVVPTSGTPRYDAGWAVEIALDVEWAHAIAPKASLLLVEARSDSVADLMAAVDTAVAKGASQVSMSWGTLESTSYLGFDAHFNKPNVSFVASSGDFGAGVGFPANSPYVTAVGGTTLKLDAASNRIDETGWSGSSGGGSSLFGQPSWQVGVFPHPQGRMVPDVAYDADPATGVSVYDSSSGAGWLQVGGTSVGAPQWAGLIALANQGRAAAGKAPLGTSLTPTCTSSRAGRPIRMHAATSLMSFAATTTRTSQKPAMTR